MGAKLQKKRKPEMTDKQAAFVREYLVDCNAKQAAIRAGFSPRTAAQRGDYLLHHDPRVSAAIQQAKAARAEKVGRTAEDVLRDIIAVTVQAREKGDLKTALKGLELQGRHLGMFTDKVESRSVMEIIDKTQRDAAVRAALLEQQA